MVAAGSLFLVRHGRPVIDPSVPAARWPLAPDASKEVLPLRDRLPDTATWFSSPEPKALGTARLLTDDDVTVALTGTPPDLDAWAALAMPDVWTLERPGL